jgi:hypothetical protein
MHTVPSPLMNALRRPVAVWLALCIALLGALVPTVSHALVWARGDATLVEICTTTGQHWVVVDQVEADVSTSLPGSPDTPGDPVLAQGLNHCPFCLLSAERTATPPQVERGPFVLPGQAVPPQSRHGFMSLSSFVFAPPPRGPPALLNF